MARREWADKLAVAQTCPQCAEQYGMGDNGDIVHVGAVATLLRKEHARAVCVVKVRDKWLLDGGYDNMSPDFQAGYHQACHHILAALRKGRA